MLVITVIRMVMWNPGGQVGIQTHLLLAAGGVMLQVPMTYRDAAVAGADASRGGTMAHSTLGPGWVYGAALIPPTSTRW